MDTITTTQHLGRAPGRGRRRSSAAVACSTWRQHPVAPACHGRGTTAGVSMHASLGNTFTLAGAENESFIKRHARHLATGST